MTGDDTKLKRKLAAVLFADAVGFSALTNEDEEGTYRQLRAHLDRIADIVAAHNGAVVNYAGDAVLADFATASEALAAAAEIQRALATENVGLTDESKVQFRIGINLGEVILDRDDIYGDGVNVAARLEGLAQPGGICISQSVHAAVGKKLALGYRDIGMRRVKNITEPIHAFQVLLEPAAAISSPQFSRNRLVIGAAALCVSIVIGAAIWFQPWKHFGGQMGQNEAAVMPVTDMPSVAILPFQNLGGDPKQDYFSDGITNDIITDLSRFSNMFVIASNSVFTYKGKPTMVKDVGRELGVSYVLEGSVQRAGQNVRINTQLIDVTSGRHLWANRYDLKLDDIFAVQDEITKSIVAALQVMLTEDEQARVARQYTSDLQAYDLFLRGRTYLRGSKRTHNKARQLFDQAINLDPKFAAAHAERSMTFFPGFIMPMTGDPKVVQSALESAQQAVALNDASPLAHARLGWAYFANRRHAEAIAEGKRAVELGPNNAEAHAQLGNILNWSGNAADAIGYIKKAMRLNPHYPFYYLFYLGHSHYLLGDREKAVELMERVVTRAPYFLPVRRHLAVLYSELGKLEKAKAHTTEVLRIYPGASIEDERSRCFYRWEPDLQKRFFDGLRQSGMPEGKPGYEPMKM